MDEDEKQQDEEKNEEDVNEDAFSIASGGGVSTAVTEDSVSECCKFYRVYETFVYKLRDKEGLLKDIFK